MTSFDLYCGLEARREGAFGSLIEPAFSYLMDTFELPWDDFIQALASYFDDWNDNCVKSSFLLGICVDDPWPPGIVDKLQRKWLVELFHAHDLDHVWRQAQAVLNAEPVASRSNLMAFLSHNQDLAAIGTRRETAVAWAHQVAREQLFRVEMAVHASCPTHFFWAEVLDRQAWCRCRRPVNGTRSQPGHLETSGGDSAPQQQGTCNTDLPSEAAQHLEAHA